ncbi:hypothetical protein PAXRUDRAFT_836504 [Paxillus rubicundulus Ve08.2h10]|uniref:Uncharacterized protein n=1 Tax=Paxillus rubicundulus Ve08.2h10 TaxID=930991 RepID=A0A0D0CXQ7_9AGAM|nr:hypothetical protein PAXRUDRAFT_836504 [Paxillus rubicundulus Ve08.2h10]
MPTREREGRRGDGIDQRQSQPQRSKNSTFNFHGDVMTFGNPSLPACAVTPSRGRIYTTPHAQITNISARIFLNLCLPRIISQDFWELKSTQLSPS